MAIPGSKQKNAQIEERRKRVAANLLAGLDYRQMAQAFGVSPATICKDVKALYKAWQKDQADTAGRYISLELKRLDVLINSLWDIARGVGDKPPDFAAIDRIMSLMSMRAKYLGQAQKIELTGPGGAPLQGPVVIFRIPDNGRGDSQAPQEATTGQAPATGAAGDRAAAGAADEGAQFAG